MKSIKYLLLVLLIAFSACSNDDSLGPTMKRSAPELDFELYVGSDKGGYKVTTDTVQSIFKYFTGYYDAALYKNTTIEFTDNLITYVNDGYKIVSTYEFIGDSLYTFKTDGSRVFIACGDKDELYITKSFSRFPITTGDSIHTDSILMDLSKVLKMSPYPSLKDMKLDTDSILWANVTYKFKRK